MHVPARERERKPSSPCRKCGWGALSRKGSASVRGLDPLLEGGRLALVLLNAHPVGVIGRRRLIAGGRRGHAVALRLAGERLGFRRRRTKGGGDRAEYLLRVGTELRRHQRLGVILRGRAGAF